MNKPCSLEVILLSQAVLPSKSERLLNSTSAMLEEIRSEDSKIEKD